MKQQISHFCLAYLFCTEQLTSIMFN